MYSELTNPTKLGVFCSTVEHLGCNSIKILSTMGKMQGFAVYAHFAHNILITITFETWKIGFYNVYCKLITRTNHT
jgi:hypothetical protein